MTRDSITSCWTEVFLTKESLGPKHVVLGWPEAVSFVAGICDNDTDEEKLSGNGMPHGRDCVRLSCSRRRFVYSPETAIFLGGGHGILDRPSPLVGRSLCRIWLRGICLLLETDGTFWANLICPYGCWN